MDFTGLYYSSCSLFKETVWSQRKMNDCPISHEAKQITRRPGERVENLLPWWLWLWPHREFSEHLCTLYWMALVLSFFPCTFTKCMILENGVSIKEEITDQVRDLSYPGLPVWEGNEGREEWGEPQSWGQIQSRELTQRTGKRLRVSPETQLRRASRSKTPAREACPCSLQFKSEQ